MFEVEEIGSAAALEDRRDEWRALCEATPSAEVFESYEWVSAWLRAFWAGREVAFLFVRAAGRLTALAPLLPDPAGVLGCPGALALPVNVRHELARKRRRLEREGCLEMRVHDGMEDGAFAEVLRIEASSWKQRTASSFTADPAVGRFYDELTRRGGAAGWLRIYLLYLDAKPIAHLFGLEHRGRYYALKTSYDEGQARFSPGSVLVALAMQDACRRGIHTFDLLGRGSRWKSELTDEATPCTEACVFTSDILKCRACALVQGRLRPAVKRHLPALVRLKRRLAPPPPDRAADGQ